ncbi:MAG: hypothetical protein ABIJ27_03795 [Candidatus Omnitrophota bacterium]
MSRVSAQRDTPLTDYQAASLIMDSAQASAETDNYRIALTKYQEATQKLLKIKEQYPTSDVSILINLKLEECQRYIDNLQERVRETETAKKFERERAALQQEVERLQAAAARFQAELDESRGANKGIQDESSQKILALNQKLSEIERVKNGLEESLTIATQKVKSLTFQLDGFKVARDTAIADIKAGMAEEMTAAEAIAAADLARNKKEFQFTLEREKKANELKIAALNTTIETLKGNVDDSRINADEALKATTEQLAKLFKNEREALERSFAEEKSVLLRKLDQAETALENERKIHSDRIGSLNSQMEDIKVSYGQRIEQIDLKAKEDLATAKRDAEAEVKMKIDSASAASAAEKESLLRALEKEKTSAASYRQQVRHVEESAKEEIASLKRAIQEEADRKAEQLVTSHASEKEALLRSFEREKAIMTASLNDIKTTMESDRKAYAQKIDQLSAQMKELRESYNEKLANVDEKARRDVAAVQQKTLEDLEFEKAKLADAFAKERESLAASIEKERIAMRGELDEKKASLGAKVKQLEEKNRVYAEQLKLSKNEITRSSEEYGKSAQKFQGEINTLVKEKKQLEADGKIDAQKAQSLAVQIDDMKMRHREELAQKEKERSFALEKEKQLNFLNIASLTAQIDTIKAGHREELAQKQKEYVSALEKEKQSNLLKAASLTTQIDELATRYKNDLAGREKEYTFALEKERQGNSLREAAIMRELESVKARNREDAKEAARVSQEARMAVKAEREKLAAAFNKEKDEMLDSFAKERDTLAGELEKTKAALEEKRKIHDARIQSFTEQMKDLTSRYKDEAARTESRAKNEIAAQRQSAKDAMRQAAALEDRLQKTILKLNELDEERTVYLAEIQDVSGENESLEAQVEEYINRNSQLQRANIDAEQTITALRTQADLLQNKASMLEQTRNELAKKYEIESERLTEHYANERTTMSKAFGRSKAQLKLARDNLENYLQKTGGPGAMMRGPAARSSEEEDEQAGARPGRKTPGALPEGSFSTVGSISSVLLMESAGRVYIELFPDNKRAIQSGDRVYAIQDERAIAELLVIDTFLALDSAVAEFVLEDQFVIQEKGIVAVLE